MNNLERESSRYLRQHRFNPVNWYPWGEEPFALAAAEDKPILLSVGYSSCHWCHVMAHECFEDVDLANLQNRLFVSIKVDREERPDIDTIYMGALQALTGSGGWPMTLFLLPDGRPFFAGTYFPSHDRHGLPGFGRVMKAVADIYLNRRDDAIGVAGELMAALAAPSASAVQEGVPPTAEQIAEIARALLDTVDPLNGGFGGAPKFPQVPLLEFLLSRAALADDTRALRSVALTLSAMARGGLHDQVGGGFHRYSVDDRWAVPHFEKMLYDQAQLISCYLHLFLQAGIPQALAVARRTADFTLDRMLLPGGGFAASLDADVDGEEGATYLWERKELEHSVAPGDRQLLNRLLRLDPAAMVGSRFVPQAAADLRPWGTPGPTTESSGPGSGSEILAGLLELRDKRPQPPRDEKVVTAWNALMVVALCELGTATGELKYTAAAEQAGRLLMNNGGMQTSRLAHLAGQSGPGLPATLEDLAATALAGLRLHEVTGEAIWFDRAVNLAEQADRELRAPNDAVWYDVAADQDPLLRLRPRALEDGATRSGNSLMVELCLRLFALTGVAAWGERAEAALALLCPAGLRVPAAFGGFLQSAQLLSSGLVELALVSAAPAPTHLALLRRARERHRPNLAIGVGLMAAPASVAQSGPPLVRGRVLRDGLPTAHVCRRFACRLPTTDPEIMVRELDGS